MVLYELQIGDVVYARDALYNDGSHPALPADAVLAEAGTRGVVVNIGHYEELPDRELFLVRFEGKDTVLGPPVGCWREELYSEPLAGDGLVAAS